MKVGRNDPCPCGSGEKYKRCCESAQKVGILPKGMMILVVVLVVSGAVGLGAVFFTTNWSDVSEGKVWSEEHGHWHDASGDSSPAGQPGPPPPGPIPPGKVWSYEHGHWHDAIGGGEAAPSQPGPPPPGPAPPGKVWSFEHGHWHDAP